VLDNSYSRDNSYLEDGSLAHPIVHMNDLYKLDPKNGKILKKFAHVMDNFISDYACVDSLIILNVNDSLNPLSDRHYELLNLKGEHIGRVGNQKNIHNLPDSLKLPKYPDIRNYLGRWNKCFVFWGLKTNGKPGNLGVGFYNFYFYDSIGKFIGVATLDNKVFGLQFFMFPKEHKKMRNGIIYILGREGKNALISELSVEKLYKDALSHPIDN
jgi:hypothetical protein